jgi:Xaa-Pro aminopeptidase
MKGNRQAFSTIEYKARLQRVQAEMRRRDIPVLLLHSPENIYYLSGYQTSGYFAYQVLIVTEAEEPTLLVRFLERGNVDEYAWLSHDETWREGDDVIVRTVEVIRSVADECRSIGIERSCWFLTVGGSEPDTLSVSVSVSARRSTGGGASANSSASRVSTRIGQSAASTMTRSLGSRSSCMASSMVCAAEI